jgi:DNA-binding NarL/FixJ family response regulator
LRETGVRVLVVDDYPAWRHFVATALQKTGDFQVVWEACDGTEAVQQAEELQPDLILLDIGLPTLNGLEAARRIREVSPNSKILFVSENRSTDIVEAALQTGAGGYVLKSDVGSELLPGIQSVLEGKRFISASLAGYFLSTVHATYLSWLLTLFPMS